MSIIKSIKQVLGLGPAAENHFWDGSVANQLSLKRGTPEAPGAELIKALNGVLSFPNQGQSLTPNGYIKLPGGLIVQWGTNSAVLDVNGEIVCVFPIVFPNAVFRRFAQNGNSNAAGNLVIGFNPTAGGSNNAASVFKCVDGNTGAAHVGAVEVFWLAIGY